MSTHPRDDRVPRLPATVALAGATYHREAIDAVRAGDAVRAVHDPTCVADINAVAVSSGDGPRIGYLPAPAAARLVARAGAGVILTGVIERIEAGRVVARFDALAPERAPVPIGAKVRSRSGLDLGTLRAHEGAQVVVEDRHGTERRWAAELVTLSPP